MDATAEAEGWAAVAAVYGVCYILQGLVPAPLSQGYVLEGGKPLVYRHNGLRVLLLVVALAQLLVFCGVVRGGLLHDRYWPCVRAGCALGLLFSAWLFLRGRRLLAAGAIDRSPFAPTTARPEASKSTAEFDERSSLEHFGCGLEWNPRLSLGVDAKMYLYLVGATMLELVMCSCLYVHVQLSPSGGGVSRAMGAYFLCMSWFVGEYMWFEEVHTYTYDIFRERTGAKLAWGCMCFYPFFYEVGIWPLVVGSHGAADASAAGAVGAALLYGAGWMLTRGANLQKHAFRADPFRETFAFLFFRVKQMSLASGGANGKKILCSGWWGLSRHANYAGEILQAIGVALPGVLSAGSMLPLLYPLYYIALFVPRQLDDDRMCHEKYGAAWEEYVRRVPYRIVPFVW